MKRFGEVWGGFGKGLEGFGDRFGRVLEGFGEGLGKVWGGATSQNEARPADRAQRLNIEKQLVNLAWFVFACGERCQALGTCSNGCNSSCGDHHGPCKNHDINSDSLNSRRDSCSW